MNAEVMNPDFLWKGILAFWQMCFRTNRGAILCFSAGIWNWYSWNLYRRVCKAAPKCLFSASAGPEHSALTNTGNFNNGLIWNASQHCTWLPSKFMCHLQTIYIYLLCIVGILVFSAFLKNPDI